MISASRVMAGLHPAIAKRQIGPHVAKRHPVVMAGLDPAIPTDSLPLAKDTIPVSNNPVE